MIEIIPWWAALVALVVLLGTHGIAVLVGAAIERSSREKADIAHAAQEQAKWQVPGER